MKKHEVRSGLGGRAEVGVTRNPRRQGQALRDDHENLPQLSRAVGIASQMRCGVYDCLYVALAEREGCELVTADDKLVKSLKQSFPFIRELASML